MKTRRTIATMVAMAVAAVCLVAMAGCAPSAETQDAAALNRAYMSKANTAMSQMNADLETFTAAVAASDVVTMEQAATAVYRDIDTFKHIPAPDPMLEIHAEYSAGCDDLKIALQGYVAVFKDAGDSDVSTINEALAPVQQKYDSGIAHLQAADTLVTKLNGAVPSSSSSSDANGSAASSASASESASNSAAPSASAASESSSSSSKA